MRPATCLIVSLLLAACGDSLEPSPGPPVVDPDREIWDGDFLLADWDDPDAVAALKRAASVTGTLEVRGDGLVALPRLESVGDDLSVSGELTELALPQLWLVGGRLKINEVPRLRAVDIGALERVGGDLWLTFADLDELSAPSLGHIGGSLGANAVEGGRFGRLSLPALTDVGAWVGLGQLDQIDLRSLQRIGADLTVVTLATELALPSLESIGDRLQIWHAPNLVRFELPALESVTGNVEIGHNIPASFAALEYIRMPNLKGIGGALTLAQLHALTRIELPALAAATKIELRELPALRSFETSLASVGRQGEPSGLIVQGTGLEQLAFASLRWGLGPIEIMDNPRLRELRLDGFDPYVEPERITIRNHPALALLSASTLGRVGTMAIVEAPALATLDLRRLEWVRGELDLDHLGLRDLSGLAALTSVDWLRIHRMDQLTSLTGLERFRRAETLAIFQCPRLTTLSGLRLTRVAAMVVMENNALASLAGLEALVEATTYLALTRNPALVELGALGSLRTVHTLEISDLPALPSLHGLEAIERMTGTLRVVGNPRLIDLSGLDHLATIGGNVFIGRNQAMERLTGLDRLVSVGGRLSIGESPRLTSLAGLEALRSIGDRLEIEDNPLLASLDGLAALAWVGDLIEIRGNPALSDEAIAALRARLGR